MLTKPRLSLFTPHRLSAKLKAGAMEKMFGFVPAAVAVELPETKLDRAAWHDGGKRSMKIRSEWSRPERELLSAFVSSRNRCRF